MPPLTGKPEQQWLTIRSGILTSISTRQRSTICDHPLSEWMGFGPTLCS